MSYIGIGVYFPGYESRRVWVLENIDKIHINYNPYDENIILGAFLDREQRVVFKLKFGL
jgi:hypothetical protein